MLTTIVKQEWRRLRRHRLAQAVLTLVVVLVSVIVLSHWQLQQNAIDAQKTWQQTADEFWQAQPERHPHRVAHYGHVVFREHSPLSFLDVGVAPFNGNFLFLEAHKQNASAIKSYPVNASSLAIGFPSVATFFWFVWPLVLIILAYGAISDEKQMNRYTWLLSLGLTKRTLMSAKAVFYIVLSTIIVAFIACVAALFIALTAHVSAQHWFSFAAMMVSFWLYSIMWVLIIVTVSAVAKNNLQSLLSSLAVWLFICVLVPKMAAPIGQSLAPVPEHANFVSQLKKDVKAVGDSHNPNDPYFNSFKQSVLDQYGVETIEELPVNYNGLVMAEGERITSDIYQRHLHTLEQTFAEHERTHQWLSWLSPTLVLSKVSVLLSGNDRASIDEFAKQAEAYRLSLIQALNKVHTEQIDHHNDRAQKISGDVWRDMALFEFDMKPAQLPLKNLLPFLVWLVLIAGLFYRVGAKQS